MEYVATRTLVLAGKTYRSGDAVPAMRMPQLRRQQLESQRRIVPLTPKDAAGRLNDRRKA